MNGTRFIVISAGLGMCGIASLAGAEGPPEGAAHLQLAARPTRLVPKRIAGIGPDMQLTTPWYEVKDQGTAEVPIGFTAQYDCFDANSTGFPEDESECGYASLRWYFGSTYVNPFVTNDMTLNLGAGAQNNATQQSWWWGGGNCDVVVFHAEDFDDTCAGPASSGTFNGVIYSFGSVGAGMYYYDPVDLTPYGLNIDNPTDGVGANIHALGEYLDDTFYLGSGQMMLWGNNIGDELSGSQGTIQWDDDNPIDGEHVAPGECHTYTMGVCPDPLGAMYASYGDVERYCFFMTCTPVIAGNITQFFVSNGPNGNRDYICVFSFLPGNDSFRNVNGYCADLNLDLIGNPRNYVVWQVNDENGTFATSIRVPTFAPVGQTVYFQVAARGTCPQSCTSNPVEKIIY